MKFLSITGPKADIDRVVNTYLSKYEIHLENALTELSTMQNITPYIQINPYILLIGMAAVEYRIAVLIAVALKFVVILFCDLSESEFNKVEIQNGGKIAVQILERLDFLCFFHQVFLFCFQFCTLLVQLAKGVIQTMDTVDGIFQGKT